MMKFILFTCILCGCHAQQVKKTEPGNTSSPGAVATVKPGVADSVSKKRATLFNNQQPFKIVSITNDLNKHTTDTGEYKCNNWKLSKGQVEAIVRHSETIDGTTWDLSFLALTCIKSVTIEQKNQIFKIEINAGAYFSVNNGDTTILFGDYNKADRKYFLEGPGEEQ